MITQIELTHFKCFEALTLPLKQLTVLSGANASGKSSIMQAFVLLHQTMREQEWSARLMLNGSLIRLGTVADVVDKVHGRRSLQIGLEDANGGVAWTFAGERLEMSMATEKVGTANTEAQNPQALRYLLPPTAGTDAERLVERVVRLTYITAERVGPREIYALEDRQAASVVGPAGEHAISLLHWGRDALVIDRLLLGDAPPTRLRQVEERMRSFFPGFSMEVLQVPYTNAVTLGLRTSRDTDFHRPTNVGFGLTQVLPIVIASVSAAEGDLLLIENPEVHLHPAAQTTMGMFVATVASAGVQVIVETHSDHILNGIRRAIKGNIISNASVALHFFRPRSAAERSPAQVESPQVAPDGGVDRWPEGFFDQFDKDTSYLAGWGQ